MLIASFTDMPNGMRNLAYIRVTFVYISFMSQNQSHRCSTITSLWMTSS